MKLLADTHLHLYPCFDLDRAFSGLLDRLAAADAQSIHAACLAERSGCDFYCRLRAGESLLRRFSVEDDKHFLRLREHGSGRQLALLPGRQIVAAERIEVLALCTDALFADGTPAAALIRAVQEQNGIPVLPWSPGKWLFQRGKVIAGLLRSFSPQDFLLGDVSLRPQGWPTPLLMRKARKMGFKIICGSDPLPFSGEEDLFGRCGSCIVPAQQDAAPDEALRALLAGTAEAISFGSRSKTLELFQRLRYNAAVRRQAAASS